MGYDLYVQMVNEAVSELKGEKPRPPAEELDLPLDAYLPDYVAREDLRIEAYRRLAVVTTHSEVDDIAGEWADRYGPIPPPAEALLKVAHLRAECIRLGITDVAVTAPRWGSGIGGPGGGRATAKLSPVSLPASAEIRLRRLAPGGSWHEDLRRLLVPVVADGPERRYAPVLVELLRALIPPPAEGAGAVAATAPGDLPASSANR